jgi:SPP1 family predicted phage head-tail adaptor
VSALRFVDAGLFDRRAVLEAPSGGMDAMGGRANGWSELRELSVRVEPIDVDVAERFGRLGATLTHRVILRHRTDVERGMAFRLGVRRLLVRSVHDPDERRRILVCRCEEET